jgi:hypothetical protein
MREVDGKKVAFVEHASYFAGFGTPSMHSTSKETGAEMVILLAPGKTEADVSDDDIRNLLQHKRPNDKVSGGGTPSA